MNRNNKTIVRTLFIIATILILIGLVLSLKELMAG